MNHLIERHYAREAKAVMRNARRELGVRHFLGAVHCCRDNYEMLWEHSSKFKKRELLKMILKTW